MLDFLEIMMIGRLKHKDWSVFREKYGINLGLFGLFAIGAMATGVTVPTADGLIQHLIRFIPVIIAPGLYIVIQYYIYRRNNASK